VTTSEAKIFFCPVTSDPGSIFEFLSDDALVVPVPRSAPLPEGAFWPAKEFCTELVEADLVHQSLPLLERAYAVPKSSFARRGERPKPSTHFESLQIASRLAGDFERIIVVDDVVTKGATLLASASRLQERFPHAEIRGFAFLRTKSFTPCGETPLDPFSGVIRYDHRNDEANREDR
jgi:predicted amidophosphoribosyltransferase